MYINPCLDIDICIKIHIYTGPPSGRQAIQVIQSAVTVPGGIGLTKALARADRPRQNDFKLGGPHCCRTVPGRGDRTGPSGWQAIQAIQSAVTVPGGIGLTEALARVGRPSQNDFKLGCPSLLPVLHRRTGPRPPDRAIGQAGHYTVCGHCPGRDYDRTHGRSCILFFFQFSTFSQQFVAFFPTLGTFFPTLVTFSPQFFIPPMFFTPKRYKQFGTFPDIHLRPPPSPHSARPGPPDTPPPQPTRKPPARPPHPPPLRPPPAMPSDAVVLGVCFVLPLTIARFATRPQVFWSPNVVMKPAGKV